MIEAPDPLAAAQHVIESDAIEPGDDFPIILVVDERALSLFTRDRLGQVVAPTEDIRRRLHERQDGPELHIVTDDTAASKDPDRQCHRR